VATLVTPPMLRLSFKKQLAEVAAD
jgi:hypothetical protein